MATEPQVGSRGPCTDDDACGEVPGAASTSEAAVVRFRPVLHGRDRATALLLVAFGVVAHAVFLGWLAAPRHWVGSGGAGPFVAGLPALCCFAALVLVEGVRALQAFSLWVFTVCARDPVPMAVPDGLRVAFVTTIVPDVEPLAMVRETLVAMRQVRCPGGSVSVWVLDEGDDAAVRATAREVGARHFTRRGDPRLNEVGGRFRARTKAGNHNAWFSRFGGEYDLVAQVDPDHVPGRHFLERTLGYFRDPDTAFVVAPQVYGDAHKSFPARGAAAQAFLFHGVVQRGGNGLGAPLLIGTNHVFRSSAWTQIGGYQDGLIEDHLTSMTVHGARNPATGRPWRGVYTPDVLAVGRAPTTWGDLFLQQRRWAQGAAEITLRHGRRLAGRLTPGQRLAYALLQSFYPSVVASWTLGIAVTVAVLAGAPSFGPRDVLTWAGLWSLSMTSTVVLLLWVRRLNLSRAEQRDLGLHGIVATLCTAPVYTAAWVGALLRRPLGYRVTPKGDGASADSWSGLRHHAFWCGMLLAGMAAGALRGVGNPVAWAWAVLDLAACSAPLTASLRRLSPSRRR